VFLITRPIHSNDVFVVFGGGNDLRTGVTAGYVADAAIKIGDIVNKLAAHGAAIFLVPNIPNKGLSPSARSAGTTAEEQELTMAFNAAVDVILNDAASRLNVKIIRVDLFTLAQSAVTMPTLFGFTNVTDRCLVGTTVCSDPDSYLFWDDIHPTARAHQFIAGAALAAFEAAGIEMNQPVTTYPSFVDSVVNEVRQLIK
jgi:phospholipase/lecithinase/hemolysin